MDNQKRRPSHGNLGNAKNGVLTVDGRLTTQLLKHFGSTSKSVSRLADGDVEDDFLDAEFTHRVCALICF